VPARIKAVHQPAGLALLECELRDTTALATDDGSPEAGKMVMLATRDSRARLLAQPGLVMPRQEDLRLNGVLWEDLPLTVLYVKPGAAAAPLLDPEGRLCGVVLAVRARGDQLPDAGLCYLLPRERLEPIVEQLLQGESRRLGWLGLSVLREPKGREGVKVAGVLEGSPAHSVGIQPGDELLQVGGRVIESQEQFAEAVCASEPGTGLRIKLRRGDGIETMEPQVGARPLLICSPPSRRPSPRTLPPAEAARRLAEQNRRLRRQIEELKRRLREQSGPAE
jgi:hypothetical protein